MNLVTALVLAAALSQTATATATAVVPAASGQDLFYATYQNCLSDAIDRQYENRARAFSERAVLSSCATVRRTELGKAVAGIRPGSRAPVYRRFAELDNSVWTVVGHLRARRSGK